MHLGEHFQQKIRQHEIDVAGATLHLLIDRIFSS